MMQPQVNVTTHFALLGHKCRDRVTGFTGIVSSICFDLYGCVQAALTPAVDKDGKPTEGHWFDTKRLEKLSTKASNRVMDIPLFTQESAERLPGGDVKPRYRSMPVR